MMEDIFIILSILTLGILVGMVIQGIPAVFKFSFEENYIKELYLSNPANTVDTFSREEIKDFFDWYNSKSPNQMLCSMDAEFTEWRHQNLIKKMLPKNE